MDNKCNLKTRLQKGEGITQLDQGVRYGSVFKSGQLCTKFYCTREVHVHGTAEQK